MFLLLILNDCCSDGIIGEASDVFGYRVWFLVYRVWCFHPSRTGSSVSILPVSLVASCQIVSILVSSLLVVVHPVGSLQVLQVHSRCWFAVGVSRRPLIAIAFYSSVVIGDVVRDSYRDNVSRILDGNGVVGESNEVG